jgi:imidazolonepropionase-like amidohydrolase
MPHHLALAAITSVPARILGVEDRVGSLAPGRDGDFVIWSGDPLEVTSRPQAIYIDGIDRTE